MIETCIRLVLASLSLILYTPFFKERQSESITLMRKALSFMLIDGLELYSGSTGSLFDHIIMLM